MKHYLFSLTKKLSGFKTHVRSRTIHPLRIKVACLVLLMLTFMEHPLLAQAMVENAMTEIKGWIIVILNVAFLIGIAIGIFKAAMKFFTGAPDKVEFMIGMIIAIALFGGFQFIVDDLAAFLGGDIALDP